MLGEDPVATVAAERPATLAVEEVDRDVRLTYAELDQAVDRTAAALVDRGVGPGERVALATDAGIPFATCFHAILRIGAIAAPLDPERSGEQGDAVLARIDPALVVAADSTAIDPREYETVAVRSLTDLAPEPQPSSWPARDPDDPACLLSTSGTTGDPRIVSVTWRNLVASAAASAVRLGVLPSDRWLTPLAPHHMGGLAPIVRSALYGTAYVALPFDTASVAATLDREAVTGVSLVPVMLRRLLEADAALADLRFVLVGGDRTPPELVRRCLDRDVPLYVTYGMTETASQIATATPDELRATPDTVGRPLRWVDVTIDDAVPEAAAASSGEIVVDGPTVAAGYWRAPEATAERFGTDGFHTRDLGLLAEDGRLFVRGRLDERIVSGGATVDPTRVQRVLEVQPAVRAAAVVGIPDDEWGERVAAMVAVDDPDTAELDTDRIRRELGDAAVPRELLVVDALPRTVSGTIDRAAVREHLADARR